METRTFGLNFDFIMLILGLLPWDELKISNVISKEIFFCIPALTFVEYKTQLLA